MKSQSLIILSILISITIFSCKDDEDDNNNNNNTCTAGTGGSVILVAFPKHHNTPIYNKPNYPDTIFVKFNTKEFPGENPSAYDLVLPGEAPEDHVEIEGLQCGDYYIFAVGFDTTISARVKGGIPYTIAEGTTGEVNINIPVTED